MPKMKQFALAESGTLVYRSTGMAYRGDYSLKVAKNGVVSVYGKNGRRIGVVGKANKTQQKRIDKTDKRRPKGKGSTVVERAMNKQETIMKRRREQRAVRELNTAVSELSDELSFGEYGYSDRPWMTELGLKRDIDLLGGGMLAYRELTGEIMTKDENKRLNFADMLDALVNDGGIPLSKAVDLWERFDTATDEGDTLTLNSIWEELTKYQKEVMIDNSDHSYFKLLGDLL